jgi:RimJ/RimL family protein N-acetyltransferase
MALLLKTPRLVLRVWQDADRDAFAALNADPEVTQDLGGPLGRRESDVKFDRYLDAFARHGFGRWAIENDEGRFVGYAGIMPSSPDHPLRPHAEIGWRLARGAWGRGYATEAGRAALRDIFDRIGFAEVLSYTSPDNARSQAVMARLGLRRTPALDFSGVYQGTPWHGVVWIAAASDVSLTGQ